ncbi:hypothetical protein HDU67_005918 [Dinochytrium kinnereticum]|nr:hypothetical protein HDU67_005918 [Dinochytrium kinnereticum]
MDDATGGCGVGGVGPSNVSPALGTAASIVVEESSGGNSGSPPRLARSDSLADILKGKTISPIGGIALLFNNMSGIGLTQTSQTYQQTGWLVTSLFFMIYMVISTLSALFIVEAMQAIPGNKYFQGTVEFGTLINFYFGPFAHIAGQLCLFGALQSNAIASIIQSSQTLDNLLIDVFGRTCAVGLDGGFSWICVEERQVSLSPFGDTHILFSFGYLAVMAFVVPMCVFPLADYIWVQIVSFVITLCIFVQWIAASAVEGFEADRVPVLGPPSGYAGLIGVVMLNYAFVQTVPAWVNCKRPNVNVQKTLWTSTGVACASYIITGLIPAFAFTIPDNANLLTVMASRNMVNKCFGYLFSMLVLMTGIPVMVLISHMNVVQNLEVNRYVALGLCYVLPWIVSLPFQTGAWLLRVNVWSSLIFVSTANFIVPLCIYLRAAQFRRGYNERRVLSEKQRKLLRIIHASSTAIHNHLNEQDLYDHESRIPEITSCRSPSSTRSPPPSPLPYGIIADGKDINPTSVPPDWLTAKGGVVSPLSDTFPAITQAGTGPFLTVPGSSSGVEQAASPSVSSGGFDPFSLRPPSIRTALSSVSNFFMPSYGESSVRNGSRAASFSEHPVADLAGSHRQLNHRPSTILMARDGVPFRRFSHHVQNGLSASVDPSINPLLADADPKREHYLFEDVPDPEAERDLLRRILAIPVDEENARGRSRRRRGERWVDDGEVQQQHGFLDALFSSHSKSSARDHGVPDEARARSRSPGRTLSWVRSLSSASRGRTESRGREGGRDGAALNSSSPLIPNADRMDGYGSSMNYASPYPASPSPPATTFLQVPPATPQARRPQPLTIPTFLISSVDDVSSPVEEGMGGGSIVRPFCESPDMNEEEGDEEEMRPSRGVWVSPDVGVSMHEQFASPLDDDRDDLPMFLSPNVMGSTSFHGLTVSNPPKSPLGLSISPVPTINTTPTTPASHHPMPSVHLQSPTPEPRPRRRLRSPHSAFPNRASSPPLHEGFVAAAREAAAFRSLPGWVSVKPWWVAVVCLGVTGATALLNIVYNVWGWGAGDLGEGRWEE